MEYKESGNSFFKEGKWKEAIEEYTKGLDAGGEQKVPADVRGVLFSNRAQCRLNLEEWQAALEDASAGLELLPQFTKLLLRQAVAYEKLGKKSEALVCFGKVARAEPTNKHAVDAARRLRDDVLASTQQKRDDVLPAHLLDMLKKSDSTVDDKLDACKKLRALCVHRSLGSSIRQAGALDVLGKLAHGEDTDKELRGSVLGVLAVMASGHEKAEDEDVGKSPSPAPDVNKPLEAPAGALEVRRWLKGRLDVKALRQLCHDNPEGMRFLCLIIGHTFEPEDSEALEVLNVALLFPEGAEVDVPRAAMIALSTLCDTRRRLGKSVKAVMPTGVLMKVIESALGCTSCTDVLTNFLASVFALFADKDRSGADVIDLAEVGLKILEPYLQSVDVGLKGNGLAGLMTLFAASTESATALLHSSPVPLAAILNTITHPSHTPEGRTAQSYAAECLLMTTGTVKTRQHFIEGGGIEMVLNALCDGEEGSKGLIRAKLIGVLSMLAAHNAEAKEEIFDRLDFLMELRHALDIVRDSTEAAKVGGKGAPTAEEAKRLARGLYESCACLTIHGEFKELLKGSKKTLKAMHELAAVADLTGDASLSFMYATIMYNICRSRADKQRPKKDQFPFNELGEDDLQALEEFYEKLPAESRPVKNGEVDCGSLELANELRGWCVNSGGQVSVVSNLAKCTANGSARVCNLAALTMKFLCADTKHRRHIVVGGGVRMLLGMVDLEDDIAKDAARQALAQVLIATNPSALNYSEQLDAVRPLIAMMSHNHELIKFEAAMALTNLLTASEEVRTRAVQAEGWQACRDLMFEENEQVQRAGIEAMCNFSQAPEILERFAEGKAELEIKIFCAFCNAEDPATQVAASGALAMLSPYEEIAPHIAKNEKFGSLLQCLKDSTVAAVQHRLVSCFGNICDMDGSPADVCTQIKAALREKLSKGFASAEAEGLAKAALE